MFTRRDPGAGRTGQTPEPAHAAARRAGRPSGATIAASSTASSGAASGAGTSTHQSAAAMVRELVIRGLERDEAGNVVARLFGLPPVRGGWTAREIDHLRFVLTTTSSAIVASPARGNIH